MHSLNAQIGVQSWDLDERVEIGDKNPISIPSTNSIKKEEEEGEEGEEEEEEEEEEEDEGEKGKVK